MEVKILGCRAACVGSDGRVKESLNFFISLRSYSAIPCVQQVVGSSTSIDFNFRFRSAILPKFQFLDFQRAGGSLHIFMTRAPTHDKHSIY
jgi:hypothetical protein